MIRRSYHNGVYILSLQKLPIVGIGPAASITSSVFSGCIVFINFTPRRLPATYPLLFTLHPIPRDITTALAVNIADGCYLQLVILEKVKEIDVALPPHADACQGGFFASRNMTFTSENVPRNYIKCSGCSHSYKKLAPRNSK
jgi:hypothetical protein